MATSKLTHTEIPRDLRDLDGRQFNAESYNRWKRAHFEQGVDDGRKEAAKEIRRAIAPALRDVKWYLSTPTEETPAKQGAREAVRAIDRATRPTKRPGAGR